MRVSTASSFRSGPLFDLVSSENKDVLILYPYVIQMLWFKRNLPDDTPILQQPHSDLHPINFRTLYTMRFAPLFVALSLYLLKAQPATSRGMVQMSRIIV